MRGGVSFKGGGADTASGSDGGRKGGVSLASLSGEEVGMESSLGGDLGGMVTLTALLGVKSSCLWISAF